MTHGLQSMAQRKVSDYANLRTIPAALSVAFTVATLFTFGGMSAPHINWFGGYDLTTDHAAMGSLIIYALAFASSETRQFENYDTWESVVIALGPIAVVGWEYVPEIQDLFLELGDPLGAQVAFLVAMGGWVVSTQ